MEDHEENYELIIESSIGILKSYSIISLIALFLIVIVNYICDLSYLWNMCFLIPIGTILVATFIQLMLCFWNIGKVKKEKIERINKRKSNLIFSSTITYFVFLGSTFLYILLSIILFS